MMRITDTFRIKDRGLVACVESDGPCPLPGSKLRRLSDGATWEVKGVERFGTFLGTTGHAGERISILLDEGPEPLPGDEIERVEEQPVYGQNLHSEPLRVAHASLIKLSVESDFKVQCPACEQGVLLVYRDQETMRLVREDRCISCAQRFVYTDESIGSEALPQGTCPDES